MSATGSDIEYNSKTTRLPTGIVKFPPNIHSIHVEHSDVTGYTTIIAKQNAITLTFVLDDDACLHLAGLLAGAPTK